jgi:hypothetical protein
LFNHANISKQAERFSIPTFRKNMEVYLSIAIKKWSGRKEA